MTAPIASLVFCSAEASTVDDLRSALASAGMNVSVRSPDELTSRPDAGPIVLVDGGADFESALAICRRLGRSSDDGFAPVVLLTGQEAAGLRRRALDAGADLLVPRSLAPADFLAQLLALVRLKDRQDQVGAKAAEAQRVHKRLQATYHQIETELELARRLQQSTAERLVFRIHARIENRNPDVLAVELVRGGQQTQNRTA